ncbi:MAG: helix-turn-helix domain-containing protein [Chloroflexota bacterium]
MSGFHNVFRELRERSGITGHRLAQLSNVNSAYIYRMQRPGGQVPRRDLLNSLISALQLSEFESERLLVAAGYCPDVVARVGTWDETLDLVAQVLANKTLTNEDREEFRQLIRAVSSRWLTPE